MLLNCHTYYSFGYGTLSPRQLLQFVKQKGYPQCVITDINNTSACIETVQIAHEFGVKVNVGIDFRNDLDLLYVGIAKNLNGFYELNSFLSKHLHEGIPLPAVAPDFENAFIVYPYHGQQFSLLPNQFWGISLQQLQSPLIKISGQVLKQSVFFHSLSFTRKLDYNIHRLLRAINDNVLLSKLPVNRFAAPPASLPDYKELLVELEKYPTLLSNTLNLLEQCAIDFGFGKFANKNLHFYTQNFDSDMQLLTSECEKAIPIRYPSATNLVYQRLNKELEIISEMRFASYFLINWDIVNYAQHKNFYYVGRGSGANSIIAYLLRITDVDPLDLDLYFERFINPYRTNPPDFDIDFSWTDRDEITNYIFNRFGYNRVALLGAYSTFQRDSVIRELGKVFGLPPTEIDKLQQPGKFAASDKLSELVLKYAHVMVGLPSHLTIHSSGILISQEPIHTYSPTFIPPKGFPTVQFSMVEAENIGLYKFDILSQRGLGKIKDAVDLIKFNKGINVDIHNIPKLKGDKKIKELLREGKTIGCFYVESPAMRGLLAKLKADDYLRLVAASSIIRPGVSRSGMMREYILRYRKPELRKKAREELPELYDLLEETYGVMVYQEDVIRVAHEFAGLSLSEADYLRRGMSWKFKQQNEFNRVKDNFFKNCLAKNHSLETVNKIWLQIESFANYAFSKGHSASYAVESYQALYLKAYFPLEYITAVLNNGGGFYKRELYVHEARMHGAVILPPCINNSTELCVIKDNVIWLGFFMVQELEESVVKSLINERIKNGKFVSIEDFCRRVQPSIEQARILALVGAFKCLNPCKKETLWQIHNFLGKKEVVSPQQNLFPESAKQFTLPKLTKHALEDSFDEIRYLGFPLNNPFNLISGDLKIKLRALDLPNLVGQTISIIGYLITVKPTRTVNNERMYFGTFIDQEGYWIDTVHFPDSAKQFPFTGPGCYLLTGKVANDFDFITIEVTFQKRLDSINRDDLFEDKSKKNYSSFKNFE